MTVSIDDIRTARERITGVVHKTPIIKDEKLTAQLGTRIYLKAENLQRAGSFKIRGAYNMISQLSPDEREKGVITASAGNHAQGVALAAQLNGIKATIVLPEFAPLTKVVATKALGAEVIMHGQTFDEAVDHSRELQKQHGFTYVHAFDNDNIIAGQGSIGMEIAEASADIKTVVVPIGGGGIISGIAIAMKELVPGARVIGVQASNVAPVRPSIEAGHPVDIDYKPTIADGIAIKRPAERTLAIIKDHVDELVEVTEEEISEAIFHLAQNAHLVVEGAGAAGVAAIMAGKFKIAPDERVCAVLCGGNIDGNVLARVIEQVLVRKGRYVIFKVLVPDRPGSLAGMLKIIAEARANVIEVYHQRAIWLAPLGSVGIETILEVRDAEHAAEVKNLLENAGLHVEFEHQGDW
ncbi:threonine ammonia-lyase [Leptolyngbya sp. 7M]|uniref:threonine ammonia-lyase n=1 Tax=Leptolyngbya sp. 7M TaxID=2812896 RepID=UPI001B8AD594|nr:threonine ammonia-lyase [Leptolyngbya sp. 7M]QYO66896.1 threonine ammonia-lyase [Leptolyngbya sp. 7M]